MMTDQLFRFVPPPLAPKPTGTKKPRPKPFVLKFITWSAKIVRACVSPRSPSTNCIGALSDDSGTKGLGIRSKRHKLDKYAAWVSAKETSNTPQRRKTGL